MRFLIGSVLVLLPALAGAQEAAAPAAMQGSPVASMLPLLLIFVVFYFLLIKPQQKKMREHTQMLSFLKKGDQVITSGGIIGKVTDADKDGVTTLEIAPGVEIKVTKASVQSLVEKPGAHAATSKKKKADSLVKNDNVVLKKDQIANDN